MRAAVRTSLVREQRDKGRAYDGTLNWCYRICMNGKYAISCSTSSGGGIWTQNRRLLRAKRALDVLVAGVGLLGSFPLWGMIALAIKWEDGGPVFFRDQRVGREGRVFGTLKFRTMVPDADRFFGPKQATEDDPRVTRVGRLLRATALDELPQLWNILRGDMSFVGPRALRSGEIHTRGNGQLIPLESVPGYCERHAVPPGLTGVAQIYADRDIPLRQKFRYDRLYIQRQSFWLDVRLILLSFWISWRGRWEQRGRKL